MFRVRHLSKTFKSGNQIIKALDDVSFDLPSKGLVFVTGKSGTGKSTLLNLLGGLSKIDNGEIYFDNIKLNDLKEKELSYYRNEFIGFMFQDFNIFDDLTVYQNIELALLIQGKKDEERIKREIDRFELTPFINQKVNRLSVGQKERVALLRAIIKDPKVLLCDEPTGNLDTLTSKVILDKLLEESKDKLVVVITHNLTEAYKYASRIIKLDEGKIVEDISFPYSSHEALIKNNTLYINDLRNLSLNKPNLIKDILRTYNIKRLESINELFIPTAAITEKENVVTLKERKIKKRKLFSFHFSLLKKEMLRSFVYLFIGVICLSIFSMCLMFYNFDTVSYLTNVLNENETKVYNLTNFHMSQNGSIDMMNIEEIPEIEKKKTEGKYFLANTSLALNNEIDEIKNGRYVRFDLNYKKFFAKETLGTLYGIDNDFIKETFNLDEVEIIELAPYKKEGIYLTDYVYDSLRVHNPMKEFGGDFYSFKNDKAKVAYINGVIKTDYLNYFKDKFDISPNNFPEYNSDNSAPFYNFVYLLSSFFNVTYSFEKDYLNHFIESDLLNAVTEIELGSSYSDKNVKEEVKEEIYFLDDDTKKETLYFPLNKINSLTEKSLSLEAWNESLKNKEIEISYRGGLTKDFVTQKVFIEVTNDELIYANEALYKIIKDKVLDDFGITYSNNNFEVASTLTRSRSSGLTVLDLDANSDQLVSRALDVYKDFFIMIGYVLLAISLFIFIFLGYETVKRKVFELGVLKGIGINIKDLFLTYTINATYLFITGTLLSFLTSYVMIKILNPLLVTSLIKAIATVESIPNLTVFAFSVPNSILLIAILLVSLTIGTLVPILQIKKIKPQEILKRL